MVSSRLQAIVYLQLSCLGLATNPSLTLFFHLTGEVYRGKLVEAEDSMNLQMTNITVTHRDGSVSGMQGCFLRGSKIVFVTMPDILKHAPVFNKVSAKASSSQAPSANILKARGRGLGRGRPIASRRPK